MFHAVMQPRTAAVSTAPSALRKRNATEAESAILSHARLRNSLAANADPCSPDDNGKSRYKTAVDLSSSSVSKRRKSSAADTGSSADSENTAPAVDASQQGSNGYVDTVTSFFSSVVSLFTGSFFTSSVDGAAPGPGSAVAAAAAAPAVQSARVVQTKTFVYTPEDMVNETPAR